MMRSFILSCLLMGVAVNATDPAGMSFLNTKKQESGVMTMPSGLMYKVLEKGTGTRHPTVDSPCDVSYAGQLINGKQFDANEQISFAPNQVIPGWTEAMQHMVEGDKWELYIPSELAYGDQGAGGVIPGGAALVFQMKLKKIQGRSAEA
eukprot:TRINITY_DN1641_c0_g1_i1.p1 TRINITY_DN1641_c0_g1~~TRINITY_DN1641_c0_g1_i1.p1  ORF type:complete len:149 (-),score=34.82 TRINITY_DN1641_c0_g1_i1:182-628(-)